MDEFALKPCPFCGGKPKLMYYYPVGGVRCPQCGVLSRCFRDVSTQGDCLPKAVEAWNKRVACDVNTPADGR